MPKFDEFISTQLGASLGSNVLSLISAIAILVIGLIIAIVVSKTVGKVLQKTEVDQKFAKMVTGEPNSSTVLNIEKWVETAVFWLLMLFVIIAFLQALNLTGVSTPLNNLLSTIFAFLPQIGGAFLFLGLAWILATVAKTIVTRGLETFKIDERLNASSGSSLAASEGGSAPMKISETVGNALYWFIFLLFIPLILGSLSLELGPVDTLLDGIASTLPKIIGAGFIGLIGWFVAKIIRTIVTNLMAAIGADQFGEKFGLSRATGGHGLSWLAGTAVFVSILIPVAISALNALEIKAISDPASEMLGDVFEAGPKIFTAAIIMAFAFAIAKIISELLTNILTGIGFNNVFEWLGIQAGGSTIASEVIDSPSIPTDPTKTTLQEPFKESSSAPLSSKTPSEIAGVIALVGILIFFLVPATDVLGFAPLTNIVTQLLQILAQVLIGAVIFAVGLYLANVAFTILSSSGGGQARLVGQAARVAIIALVAAMALQQMGIATSIVNLAFGLLFGAVAIALAVAFGFGGIDVASEEIKAWLADFKSKD